MASIIENSPASDYDVCKDDLSRADKAKVTREQEKAASLFSVADTFQFLSAVMMPVGLGALIAAAKGGTLAAIGAAMATPTVAIFLGAAVLCTTIAIGSRYFGNKHYQGAAFNSSEINAQHNAKYIVRELKKENTCLQSEVPEYQQNERSDGKNWSQVIQQTKSSEIAI